MTVTSTVRSSTKLLITHTWSRRYSRLHAQYLNRKHEELSKELQQMKEAHGNLESALVSRGRRLDVLFSAVNEVVMRVDRLGRVMAVNPHASSLFEMSRTPVLPQSMLLFYRDPEWNRFFFDST